MLKFFKDWMLPIAMLAGALTYPWVSRLAFLTPYLIFAMLLFTFSKIEPGDIRLRREHVWLLLVQLMGSGGLYLLLRPVDRIIASGALLCLLTPTAASAPVVTGMLGGDVGFLTSYVILCNVTVAPVAPVYFSLIGIYGSENLPFVQALLFVCKRVFTLCSRPSPSVGLRPDCGASCSVRPACRFTCGPFRCSSSRRSLFASSSSTAARIRGR